MISSTRLVDHEAAGTHSNGGGPSSDALARARRAGRGRGCGGRRLGCGLGSRGRLVSGRGLVRARCLARGRSLVSGSRLVGGGCPAATTALADGILHRLVETAVGCDITVEYVSRQFATEGGESADRRLEKRPRA